MQRFRGNPGKLRAATIKADLVRRRPGSGPRLSFVMDPVTRRFIRPVLIAVMATALASSLLVIATIGTPEEPWYWLIPYIFLVTLTGVYSAAWLNRPLSRSVDKTIYRVAEVIVIVALARIVSWALFADAIPSLDQVRLYLQEPLRFFLAGGFLTTTITALVGWLFAGSLSGLFWRLDVSEEELRFYTMGTSSQKSTADDQPIQVPRQELQDAYLRYFLGGAMALVLMAALSTFEVRQFDTVSNPLAITRLGLEPAMLVILLLYFLIGIWLLSQSRLLRLNARWLMDGVGMDATLERRWQRTSLTWLLLIAVAAAFLPIGNTLPITRLLRLIVNGVFYLANLAVSLIVYLFGSMLATMQSATGDPPPIELLPFTPPAYTIPPEAGTSNPLAAIFLSSAFWALIAAVVIGSVLFVVRERGYDAGWDRIRAGASQTWAWLVAFWAQLLGRAGRAAQAVPDRLRALRPESISMTSPETGRRRYFRLNGLSPREQILYFYLSTVKRAGEKGVPRGTSETPIEYAAELKQHWPDTEPEVEELTSAFIEARYSPADIPPETAETIKSRWKRLRDRLRQPNTPAR